jgi:hypothetical protein
MHHETSATRRAPTLPEDDYGCRNHRRSNHHYVNHDLATNRSSNPNAHWTSHERTKDTTDGTNFQ